MPKSNYKRRVILVLRNRELILVTVKTLPLKSMKLYRSQEESMRISVQYANQTKMLVLRAGTRHQPHLEPSLAAFWPTVPGDGSDNCLTSVQRTHEGIHYDLPPQHSCLLMGSSNHKNQNCFPVTFPPTSAVLLLYIGLCALFQFLWLASSFSDLNVILPRSFFCSGFN